MSMPWKNLESKEEEFNNFMHKVSEVERIVHKLASKDSEEQAIGDAEAKRYLGESEQPKEEIIDVENMKLRVKSDRTVINKKAFQEVASGDQSTISQEAFMREVERDADRRYQDRKIRQEKMETLKKQATLAFNREDFIKALSCYNKALDLVKDNHNLFLNRGLTYIKLKLYDKALVDIDRAIYLNENSLKGYLLKAKILFLTGNNEDMKKISEEAKEKHPKKADFIDELTHYLKNNASLCQENHYQEILANTEKTAKDLEVMYTSLQMMKYEFAKLNAQSVKIETYLALNKKILNEALKELENEKTFQLDDDMA